MYLWTHEGLGQSTYLGPDFDRAKAVKANRQFRNTLGWKTHLKRVHAFLNMSQVEVDDEQALAVAVATWQHAQTPALAVDGTIGPTTWSRMRAAGVLKASSWWNQPCRTTPITNGEFGTALKWFTNTRCVPDEVVKLLKGSSTFLKIANTLDSKYIALVGLDVELAADPMNVDWEATWGINRDGILTKGTYRGSNVKGRRLLWVRVDFFGSRFSSSGSPEDPFMWDTIWLQPPSNGATKLGKRPDATEIGRWIENISHESIHACHRVARTAAPAANLVDRVRECIAEERITRKMEARVVSEIQATTLGKKLLNNFRPTTGAMDEAAVQRDFFPSKLQRTYLEQCVLMALLDEAIRRERLSAADLANKNKEVDRIPLTGWRNRKFSSDVSKVLFWLRVIDFRWKRARELRTPDTPEFERLKEQVLHEHANAFFGGSIAYTARP